MLFTFNRRVESVTGEVDEGQIAQVVPRMPVVLANEVNGLVPCQGRDPGPQVGVSRVVAEMAEMRNDRQPNLLDAIALIGSREMPKSDTATDHGVEEAVKPVPGRGELCGGRQALRESAK